MLKEYVVVKPLYLVTRSIDHESGQPFVRAVMRPVATYTATGPEHALQIAKRKGHIAPIIAEKQNA